jgi:MYXO-CTERM domain-containing protein
MGATSGVARLVHTTDLPDSSAVTTTVPRSEIEEALNESERTPELALQIVRMEDGAESQHELGVDWERSDLERILESAQGETVTLTFKRDDLESALDDVEAHGMRERAAILTVAVATAAGGTAAVSQAMPVDPGGESVPAAVQAAPDLISDAGSGGGLVQTSASDALVSDAGSGGGLVQANPSDSMVSDAGSGGGLVQANPSDSIVSDAGSGGGLVQSSSAADQMISDAGSGGPRPITGDNGSGGSSFSVPTPDPATTGMLAGMGLLIAGAAFTVRRRDTHRPV